MDGRLVTAARGDGRGAIGGSVALIWGAHDRRGWGWGNGT